MTVLWDVLIRAALSFFLFFPRMYKTARVKIKVHHSAAWLHWQSRCQVLDRSQQGRVLFSAEPPDHPYTMLCITGGNQDMVPREPRAAATYF